VRLHQLVGQRLGSGSGLQEDRTGQVGALPNTRVNGLNVFIRERVRSSSVANKYTDELKGLLVHSRLQQMIVGLPPTWAGARTLLPQPPFLSEGTSHSTRFGMRESGSTATRDKKAWESTRVVGPEEEESESPGQPLKSTTRQTPAIACMASI